MHDDCPPDLAFILIRAEPLLVLVADGISPDPGRLAWQVLELLSTAPPELQCAPTSLRCRWRSPVHGELVIDRDPERPIVAVVRAADLELYAAGPRVVSRTAQLRAPEAQP